MTLDEMQTAIVADLTTELNTDATFNADILNSKVASAIRSVKLARRYPSSYTDDRIATDMEQYYDIIEKVSLARYNRVGADDEAAHSENGVNRTYIEEKSLLNGVIPLARCL